VPGHALSTHPASASPQLTIHAETPFQALDSSIYLSIHDPLYSPNSLCHRGFSSGSLVLVEVRVVLVCTCCRHDGIAGLQLSSTYPATPFGSTRLLPGRDLYSRNLIGEEMPQWCHSGLLPGCAPGRLRVGDVSASCFDLAGAVNLGLPMRKMPQWCHGGLLPGCGPD
jgi:hypothetical protein